MRKLTTSWDMHIRELVEILTKDFNCDCNQIKSLDTKEKVYDYFVSYEKLVEIYPKILNCVCDFSELIYDDSEGIMEPINLKFYVADVVADCIYNLSMILNEYKIDINRQEPYNFLSSHEEPIFWLINPKVEEKRLYRNDFLKSEADKKAYTFLEKHNFEVYFENRMGDIAYFLYDYELEMFYRSNYQSHILFKKLAKKSIVELLDLLEDDFWSENKLEKQEVLDSFYS